MENFKGTFDKILIDSLGIDKNQIQADAKFKEDLGADSLTMIEIVMEFENQFKVTIPDEVIESITTVQDAEEYLHKAIEVTKAV